VLNRKFRASKSPTFHILNVAIHLKKILLISTFILIFSCQKTTETRYYPSKKQFENSNISIINIDNTKLDFNELNNKIERNQESGINTVIEFLDNGILRKIIPFKSGNGLIKMRNVLVITPDSILIENGFTINKLKILLKKHYLNNGKNQHYSDSPKRAIVELLIDSSKSKMNFKKTLLLLTKTFDEINTETNNNLELNILFENFRQPKIPQFPNTE